MPAVEDRHPLRGRRGAGAPARAPEGFEALPVILRNPDDRARDWQVWVRRQGYVGHHILHSLIPGQQDAWLRSWVSGWSDGVPYPGMSDIGLVIARGAKLPDDVYAEYVERIERRSYWRFDPDLDWWEAPAYTPRHGEPDPRMLTSRFVSAKWAVDAPAHLAEHYATRKDYPYPTRP